MTELQVISTISHTPADKRNQLVTQQSTVWTRRQQAVCVRRAFKYYGTKKRPQVVLDDMDSWVLVAVEKQHFLVVLLGGGDLILVRFGCWVVNLVQKAVVYLDLG
ncbi:hypothetical protein C0J52_10025 [Blattella germanica]|nr:hypothetical protein C0J52_10025 [Blattella germanica]